MPRVNPHAIRLRKAAELDTLARVLSAARAVGDPYPLHAAAEQCRIDLSGGEQSWNYTVAGLLFRATPTLRSVRPPGALDLSHELTVAASGVCQEDPHPGDPFTALNVDIVGKARLGKLPLIYSWHLDRNLARKDDGEPSEIHPLYHFQFGGISMFGRIDSGTGDFGELLLLEAPRIAHPPLEAILAVDFLLSNFYMEMRSSLIGDPDYHRLVVDAQKAYWAPYALVTASPWHLPSPAPGSWEARHLWPQIP